MATVYSGTLLKVALLAISATILKDNIDHEALTQKLPKTLKEPFDYIIIGGGTAGCVIAARLSEDPNIRVLLIEKGDVETVSNDIPAMDIINLAAPPTGSKLPEQLNQYVTVPQSQAAQAFENSQVPIITARILGGGSAINGMMYNRGGANDYDGWVLDYSAHGWSFEEVLPFFKKSENETDRLFKHDRVYHGTRGPMTITTPDITQAPAPYQLYSDTFIQGAAELGYLSTDISGPNQLGATRIQRTMRNGKRLSTATAYLIPALNRNNLYIITTAFAQQIFFENKRATAVQFRYTSETFVAKLKVTGEFILCAGALASAQLLLVSGVGPQEDLKALGIPVVADLPVGHNLHDHARSGGVDFVVNTTIFSYWQDLLTVENLESFYTNGTGPLASQFNIHQAGAIQYQTNVPTGGATFGPADIMIEPGVLPPGELGLSTGSIPFLEPIQNYYAQFGDQPTLHLFPTLNYVKSRGQLKLITANMSDPPSVDPAYLTHPEDLARLIEGYKFSMALGKTEAYQKIGARPFEGSLPGCERFFSSRDIYDQSDAYIACKIRHLSGSQLHVCGTCKMGSPRDKTAVVDTRLRVLGRIKGVRVADASIFPSIPTGNPMMPVIMVAEKAAAMILEDRKHFI